MMRGNRHTDGSEYLLLAALLWLPGLLLAPFRLVADLSELVGPIKAATWLRPFLLVSLPFLFLESAVVNAMSSSRLAPALVGALLFLLPLLGLHYLAFRLLRKFH